MNIRKPLPQMANGAVLAPEQRVQAHTALRREFAVCRDQLGKSVLDYVLDLSQIRHLATHKGTQPGSLDDNVRGDLLVVPNHSLGQGKSRAHAR